MLIKNQEHTTRQTDYMAGNVKKFGFLKINFKNGVEKLWAILPKKKHFFTQNFFSVALRNFSLCRMTMFKLSERLSKHSSLCWKKIRNVRHVKQIIWQETRKSLHFYFENGVEKLWGYPSKTTILDSKLFFRKLLENFLFVA